MSPFLMFKSEILITLQNGKKDFLQFLKVIVQSTPVTSHRLEEATTSPMVLRAESTENQMHIIELFLKPAHGSNANT